MGGRELIKQDHSQRHVRVGVAAGRHGGASRVKIEHEVIVERAAGGVPDFGDSLGGGRRQPGDLRQFAELVDVAVGAAVAIGDDDLPG